MKQTQKILSVDLFVKAASCTLISHIVADRRKAINYTSWILLHVVGSDGEDYQGQSGRPPVPHSGVALPLVQKINLEIMITIRTCKMQPNETLLQGR